VNIKGGEKFIQRGQRKLRGGQNKRKNPKPKLSLSLTKAAAPSFPLPGDLKTRSRRPHLL